MVDDRADVHISSKDGRLYLECFRLGCPYGTYPPSSPAGAPVTER
ncbi:hypothetical protein AB0I84_29865 [Streptomyces spectabilis]